MPAPPATIEKLMSLSQTEFEHSIRSLGPELAVGRTSARFDVGAGAVTVDYEALPALKIGGLLSLPQARVTLVFEGVDSEARAAFIRRFDIAFQRGGG